MRNKLIECKINNDFSLGADNYNWILYDYRSSKVNRRYFPSIEHLSKFIVELKAKESLLKNKECLGDLNNLTPAYDAVTTKISQELTQYFSSITNGMSYQQFYKYEINNTVSTPRFLHKESSDVLL